MKNYVILWEIVTYITISDENFFKTTKEDLFIDPNAKTTNKEQHPQTNEIVSRWSAKFRESESRLPIQIADAM